MAQRDAIRIINKNNQAFDTEEQKVLRKLMDRVYADMQATATAAAQGIVIVSTDAGNDITAGQDGGAFYDAVP